ncbi:Cathelicidin-B1 [Liparis tanakae]|uniref:Cathelicidin-B1 n=1 Tax=Liparis tanakae TaxID=230148 RepID=A0A4Z2HLL8_9TELE|nr:Cathelicidin-B1 [Liparis tanakae]
MLNSFHVTHLHRPPGCSRHTERLLRELQLHPSRPPSLQASIPPSLQASRPASLQASIPPGLHPSRPASLQACIPPGLQASIPPSLQASIPPGLQPSRPPSLQASIPPSLQTSIHPQRSGTSINDREEREEAIEGGKEEGRVGVEKEEGEGARICLMWMEKSLVV